MNTILTSKLEAGLHVFIGGQLEWEFVIPLFEVSSIELEFI